jgi:hypothetical protein
LCVYIGHLTYLHLLCYEIKSDTFLGVILCSIYNFYIIDLIDSSLTLSHSDAILFHRKIAAAIETQHGHENLEDRIR